MGKVTEWEIFIIIINNNNHNKSFMCGHQVVTTDEIRWPKSTFISDFIPEARICPEFQCHLQFVSYKALQQPRQPRRLLCWINTMTDHKVPPLLIYFNWCVIYAAVRFRFALLSINKPRSKSQSFKENGKQAMCHGTVSFALLLYGWPAQCASCWKVICMTHFQALIHLFSNRGANLCWKHGRSEENIKVPLIHS